jgi:tRNA1(Val) A37 N6-methylase TrmN6
MTEIFKNETVDTLSRLNLKIIQKKDGYRFSLDAILLADFTSKFILPGAFVLEFGTGSGVIPITLASKIGDIRIIGLEIQEDLCEMAKRSVKLNKLEDKIKIIKGDLKESSKIFKEQRFDIVIANPPYKPKKSGRINIDLQKAIARHELECNLKELVKASSFLTKVKGRVILVYSPERISVLIYELRTNGFEPKHIRFIHSFTHSEAKMVLIESVKGGRPGVKVLPPLVVYKGRGDYSEEVKKIYHF